MNEESLAKYIKALPANMLNEYDAAAAAGAQGGAGGRNGGTTSGRNGDNKNRFPFLAPVLVLVGVIIAVTAVIIVRNKKNNQNVVLSEDPTGMIATLLPNEVQTPTEVPATPEFTGTTAPTDTITSIPTSTDAPETAGTPVHTDVPPETTETPAPTDVPPEITETPAPTDVPPETTETPAPTDVPPVVTETPVPTPVPVRIDRLDPVITKGELQVGETVQLTYRAYPENYEYGTVRWKLTSGSDCASIDPETGVLTALKPGSVGVLPYVVEYETKNSPAGLVITAKNEDPEYSVPEHDMELPEKYRPDANVSGSGWTEERIRIRNSFLVYNGQTPDDLPKYKRRASDDYSYGNSPYENDLILFVKFSDWTYMDGNLHDRDIALKGIKVTFTDAVTGKTVGYSYTNADGIAMFTIKKQEIDFIVSAEIPGYDNSNPGAEEYRHIIYPGGGEQNGFEENVAYSGPYTNSGIVRSYSVRVYGNDAVEYAFKVLNAATGDVLDGGRIDIYYEISHSYSYSEDYSLPFIAYEDFFDLIDRVTYSYGEGNSRKRVDCTYERSGDTFIIYAQISQN